MTRTALITGASRGIGLATARALAGRGDGVFLVARSDGDLAQAADEIRRAGGQAWYQAADVTQPHDCDAIAEAALEHFGALDVAVMSAGVGHWAPTTDMRLDQWRETMAVNVDAVFYTTRALLPAMVRAGRGHLVYISSVLGRRGVPNMAAYAASKAAVSAFAESVAAEAKPHGIRVTVVYPGTTATGMRDHQVARPKTPDITDPDLQLAPEDVADAIAWATSVSDRAFPTAITIEPRGVVGRPTR